MLLPFVKKEDERRGSAIVTATLLCCEEMEGEWDAIAEIRDSLDFSK